MKITHEAKKLIISGLDSNDCDCLNVTLDKSCCGTSVNFSMVKLTTDDKPISINGVSVLMDKQGEKRTETVTLEEKGGKLIIQDTAASCC